MTGVCTMYLGVYHHVTKAIGWTGSSMWMRRARAWCHSAGWCHSAWCHSSHATLCADCIVHVSTGPPIFACLLIHITDAATDIDMCASRGGTSVAIGVSASQA